MKAILGPGRTKETYIEERYTQGEQVKTIARELGISESKVLNHIRTCISKEQEQQRWCAIKGVKKWEI